MRTEWDMTMSNKTDNGFMKRLVLGSVVAGAAALWAMGPRSAFERKQRGVRVVPDVFYAHRGLHDAGSGLTEQYAAGSGEYVALARRMALRAGYGTADHVGPIAPENSMAAFAAACEAGYGIELDIQLTADGQVVVVHDGDLLRVAGDGRAIADLTYDELSRIALFPAPAKPGDAAVPPVETAGAGNAQTALHGDGGVSVANGANGVNGTEDIAENIRGRSVTAKGAMLNGSKAPQGYYQHVPLFADVLRMVHGRVPIIVEYKFCDYSWDDRHIELMKKGAALLDRYQGAYVVESFHPMAMEWYAKNRPEVCRGQLAEDAALAQSGIKDWAAGKLLGNWMSRPDFVAYDWHGGNSAQLRLVKAMGVTAVSWTVRSHDELDACSGWFNRHIFESFVPQR